MGLSGNPTEVAVSASHQSSPDRWRAFAVTVSVVTGVWLLLLPAIGSLPAVSEHIALQKSLRIDPSAMFYTELEKASEIASHAERVNETHPLEFWSFGRPEPKTEPAE